MSKIYKGLVKRLLSQLEIDIELDKAMKLCNAFHAELSQGEAENKVIVDYDEKLKSFYINDNQPSTEALQGEPIGYFFKHLGVWSQITSEFTAEENTPLYLAPPSTEALQKDKAEIIEYAKMLLNEIDNITSLSYMDSVRQSVDDILYIPKPKCMEQ